MASQKHLRSTYFSTPSTLGHGAFPFWSGELFNKGRKHASEHVEIDISHSALAAGKLCDDGQWRQIVTIEDALRGGCNLFDLDVLKRENSAEDFRNLFMCEFVDDSASVFPFEELQGCMVDSLVEWTDVNPMQADLSVTGRCGSAMTRRTPATAPVAWCWLRRWSPAANSAYWSATSGKAWISPRRPNLSAG